MRRMLLAACLCLASVPLTGCVRDDVSGAKARTAIDRAELAYARVRGSAEAALPLLPAPIAARVRNALLLADAAMAVIRSDATPAERRLALRQLTIAVAAIVADLSAR